MKRIVAMGAAAAIASLAFVTPAEAAKVPPKGNRPVIQVSTDPVIMTIPAGQACAFPVEFVAEGRATTTVQRQKTKEVVDATVTLSNGSKSVTLNADATYVYRMRKDGSVRTTATGNSFFFAGTGELTIEGKPAPSGALYIQGQAKATAEGFDLDDDVNFTKIKGKVTDVCTLID